VPPAERGDTEENHSMGGKKKSQNNLRSHSRVAIRIPADYQIHHPGEEKSLIPFETENIGNGGLMFYSSDRVETGVQLRTRLFIGTHPVEFTAQVIWTNERPNLTIGEKPFAIGLQYLKISPEAASKINQITWL
jgi:hypothetical protein